NRALWCRGTVITSFANRAHVQCRGRVAIRGERANIGSPTAILPYWVVTAGSEGLQSAPDPDSGALNGKTCHAKATSASPWKKAGTSPSLRELLDMGKPNSLL